MSQPSNSMESSQSAADKSAPARNSRNRLFLWGGHGLVALGFVGIMLPLLPTTIFWILAAMCYAKSSPEHYQRILNHSRYGRPVRDFTEHGVISSAGKWAAVTGMSISAIVILLSPLSATTRMITLLVLLAAAVYVVTRPGTAPDPVTEPPEA